MGTATTVNTPEREQRASIHFCRLCAGVVVQHGRGRGRRGSCQASANVVGGLVLDQVALQSRAALEKGIVDVAAGVVVESKSGSTHTENGRHGQQSVQRASLGWPAVGWSTEFRFAAAMQPISGTTAISGRPKTP